jgi:hypothetical protein
VVGSYDPLRYVRIVFSHISGMACRMITDLGLHETCIPIGQTGAENSSSESVLLHRLLCACISYEGIWCIYLGRPSSIPRSVLDTAFVRCNNDGGQEGTIMAAWVGLCIPMGEICEVLNCSGSLDSKATSRLLELDTELQKWQGSLPPSIAYDERRLMDLDPVAFGMHMQCCKIQILVYQAIGRQGQEQRHQLIHDKALRIIRLLLTYRQIHGVEKVPSIMLDSANLALTTIISFCQDPLNLGVPHDRDIQWLHMSIDTLRGVQSHFPVTQRMLHTLEKMADGPQLAGLFTAATSPSPESPQKQQPAHRMNDTSPGGVRDTHVPPGMDGNDRTDSPFGAVNRFAHGDHFLSQQPPVLDCEWLPHDPGEASAALLSFPDLQLASLWLPTTSSAIGGENIYYINLL